MHLFDTVLVTASSEPQARAFRALLQRRVDHGLYPHELRFEVVADPPGRVGTGGSTLWALQHLLRSRGGEAESFFARERLLILHAGGESRRLPCSAPEGKLFSPLPIASSALLPPVVLDVQLALFLKYPWRPGEVLISSGDVVIDFDTSALPDQRSAVFGFAKPASPEQGARHGVFGFDHRRERVLDYFQKAPIERLLGEALLEGTADCALDLGLVSLSPEAVRAFFRLAETPCAGSTLAETLAQGRLRFDLYLEVLTACLAGLSFDAFWNRVSSASALRPELARSLYEAFHPLGLGGTVTRSTLFEHVGSLVELPAAALSLLAHRVAPFYEAHDGEIRAQVAQHHVSHDSIAVQIESRGPRPSLVEGCERCALHLEGGNVVVGLEGLSLPFALPPGFMLDGRHLPEGLLVVVMSDGDSFKPVAEPARIVFCGRPLDHWLTERGLSRADVFDRPDSTDLFEARLFAVDPSPSLLHGYLEPPSPAWRSEFLAARRFSIAEANERDDPVRRENRRLALRREGLREAFRQGRGWREISVSDFRSSFGGPEWRQPLRAWLARTDDALLRAYRERLCRAVGLEPESDASALPVIDYVPRPETEPPLAHALKEDQIVWARAPLRLDLAGGWTDTPPYTLREGGRVVNLAVDLNGQPPIQVFCRRTAERRVRIHSIDLGHTETLTRLDELRDYRDPVSPFALPKAALCLMGLDSHERDNPSAFDEALRGLGGGLEITLLCAVPKGSGLGTSSVLGGVILAALSRFFGRPLVMDLLIRQVLQLEQMLTTGGGWQDQIGGLVGGVKCVESRPGLRPHPVIHQLDPFLFQDPESLSCFSLFYTGITRLARNILAEVVDRVNGAEKSYLFTLRHMAALAQEAKDAIELRDREALGRVIASSWAANTRVHPSTSNDDVEAILSSARPHILGAKLLGAGGGGYALFLSASPRDAAALRQTLGRFDSPRARLVDFSLSTRGLEVSVS